MPSALKLTQHFVDGLPTTGSDYKKFDTVVAGFHIRVHPSGRKTYAFQYRTRTGLQRNIMLGKVTEGIKLEAVRREARRLMVEVESGGDPSEARKVTRRSANMSELFDEYMEKHARVHKKPRSIAEDARNWRMHLAPRFGRLLINQVSRRDLDGFKSCMADRPGAANRCLALLSKMMTLAVRWEYRADNPCKGVVRNPENQLENFLTNEQVSRLLVSLDSELDRGAATALELLLLTGARRGEVLQAQWNQFDLDGDIPSWTVPSGALKTSSRVRSDLRRPLSKKAADLLTRWRRSASVTSLFWVFPSSRDASKPRYDLKDAWQRVRTDAGLPGLRVHDLRHSYASAAVNAGASLYAVGSALGHRDLRTTKRYAHLNDEGVRGTAEAVAAFASRSGR